MKRTIRVFSLLLAAVMLLSARHLPQNRHRRLRTWNILGNIYVDCRA